MRASPPWAYASYTAKSAQSSKIALAMLVIAPIGPPAASMPFSTVWNVCSKKNMVFPFSLHEHVREVAPRVARVTRVEFQGGSSVRHVDGSNAKKFSRRRLGQRVRLYQHGGGLRLNHRSGSWRRHREFSRQLVGRVHQLGRGGVDGDC